MATADWENERENSTVKYEILYAIRMWLGDICRKSSIKSNILRFFLINYFKIFCQNLYLSKIISQNSQHTYVFEDENELKMCVSVITDYSKFRDQIVNISVKRQGPEITTSVISCRRFHQAAEAGAI